MMEQSKDLVGTGWHEPMKHWRMPGFLPESVDGMPASIDSTMLVFMLFLPFLQEMAYLLPSMRVSAAFSIQ